MAQYSMHVQDSVSCVHEALLQRPKKIDDHVASQLVSK